MARQKVENTIKSWGGVDAALLEVGRIERRIEALEADAQGFIEEIKERTVADVKPLLERKNFLVAQMALFCDAHREEMKGKSWKLNFGTVSFRATAKIVISKVKACVEALLRLRLMDCLHVKYTPDKEQMKELDDTVLAQVGAKRVEADEFGYVLDREKVKEAA